MTIKERAETALAEWKFTPVPELRAELIAVIERALDAVRGEAYEEAASSTARLEEAVRDLRAALGSCDRYFCKDYHGADELDHLARGRFESARAECVRVLAATSAHDVCRANGSDIARALARRIMDAPIPSPNTCDGDVGNEERRNNRTALLEKVAELAREQWNAHTTSARYLGMKPEGEPACYWDRLSNALAALDAAEAGGSK